MEYKRKRNIQVKKKNTEKINNIRSFICFKLSLQTCAAGRSVKPRLQKTCMRSLWNNKVKETPSGMKYKKDQSKTVTDDLRFDGNSDR